MAPNAADASHDVDTPEKREQLKVAVLQLPDAAPLMQDGWVDSACLGRYLRARKGNVRCAVGTAECMAPVGKLNQGLVLGWNMHCSDACCSDAASDMTRELLFRGNTG